MEGTSFALSLSDRPRRLAEWCVARRWHDWIRIYQFKPNTEDGMAILDAGSERAKDDPRHDLSTPGQPRVESRKLSANARSPPFPSDS